MILAVGLASCQESDDTPEEFPDWQNTNDLAFQKIYEEAQAKIAAGDTSWKIVASCLESTGGDIDNGPEECIVMQRIVDGVGNSPYYTDTVAIHYAGWLQPSTRYKNGLRFDASYYGNYYDHDVSPAYKGCVNSFIQGFSTALQYMRRGDGYMVYIPYHLAYGASGSSSIPGYSMLTFEILLEDFWHTEPGDRN